MLNIHFKSRIPSIVMKISIESILKKRVVVKRVFYFTTVILFEWYKPLYSAVTI